MKKKFYFRIYNDGKPYSGRSRYYPSLKAVLKAVQQFDLKFMPSTATIKIEEVEQ